MYTRICGFSHSIFVTTPVNLTFLFASYSVSNPWWATTGTTRQKKLMPAIRMPSFVLIATPPENAFCQKLRNFRNSPPKLGGVPFACFLANGGVVPQVTTPSAPGFGASRHFLGGAATPPNLGRGVRDHISYLLLVP